MATGTQKRTKKSSTQDRINHLAAFEFHGFVPDRPAGDQVIGTCPFCGHDKKCFVSKKTGQWDCKSCARSGNKYTFLELLYESALQGTTKADYKRISKARQNLPPQCFSDFSIAFDRVQRQYLIPYRDDKGSLTNLGRWSGAKGQPILKTPTCKLQLFGMDQFQPSGPIFIDESEWNAIALHYLLSQVYSADEPFTCLATPGANVFDEHWLKLFLGREIVILGDHDEAGNAGIERKTELLHRIQLKNLHVVHWPDSFPEKFDTEDFVASDLDKPTKLHNQFKKFQIPIGQLGETGIEEDVEPIEDFKVVVKEYKKHVNMTPELIDCLAFMFAVTFSIRDEMLPIWAFVVGGSGAGKTMLLQSIGNTRHTHFEGTLGPNTLVTGYGGQGFDPSLLPRLIGRTLVIEDFTKLLTSGEAQLSTVLGTLRLIYTGRYEQTYGNNLTRVYPESGSPFRTCWFSMIAGVTPAIQKHERQEYGERFIRYNLSTSDIDTTMERAFQSLRERQTPEFNLRPIANRFLAREVDTHNLPTVPIYLEKRLKGLGKIISYIRSTVSRNKGALVYRPVRESPTRVVQVLWRLGQFLAFVYGKKIVDLDCYRLLHKTAFDSSPGWTRDIFMELVNHPDGIRREDLQRFARVEMTQTHRSLSDLIDLGAVNRITIKVQPNKKQPPRTKKGPEPFLYKLSKGALEAIKESHFDEY